MTDLAARRELKTAVVQWAEKLDVRVNSLSIRPMQNKWASCSTAGNLSFNSELIQLDDELRTYVIVHELLHFSVPNHGKLWKALMRLHLGEYEELEHRLRRLATKDPIPIYPAGVPIRTP